MNTLGIGGGRPRTRPDGDTVKELKCSKCLKVLPKDAFPWRGLQRGYACKECDKERRRKKG